MLEKLKALAEIVKIAVLYILTPLLIIGALLLKMRSDKAGSVFRSAKEKAEDELAKTLAKKEGIDEKSHDSATEYERVKRAYLDSKGLGDGHGNND